MGDSMHTFLTVGPLTSHQKANLRETVEPVLKEQGISWFEPDPLENDPDRFTFEIGDVNYGVQLLGSGNGSIQELIDANMPYRVTDDGGAYHNGTDVIWHPDFEDLPPLQRQANSEGKIVVSETLVGHLSNLNPVLFARTIRGIVKTDPSDPGLLEAYRVLVGVLRALV